MSEKDTRKSEIDRRSKVTRTDEKQIYKSLEKRSGEERRKWIDRMHEIYEKLK